MADISKITLPTGTTYDIKDATAREAISNISGFDYIICTNAANTPKDVVWNNDGTAVTGTLEASSETKGKMYLVPSNNGTKDVYDEYISINTTGITYIWEMFGNTDVHVGDLGTLAYKNSATGSFTPSGSVSQPSFTGTQGSVSVSGTPEGSVSFTSDTKYVAESATGGGSVTDGVAASCTLPSFSTSVSNETLVLSWSAGSFTANTPTEVTLPSFTSQDIPASASFSGSSMTSTGSFTPEGSVSQPSFTGSSGSVSVS